MKHRLIVATIALGAAPAAAQPAPPPEPDPPPPPPKRLRVGRDGFFHPGLLAQAWFQGEGVGGDATLAQFRLRRAALSTKGEIVPDKVAYTIMFDLAKVRETQQVTVAGPPDAMGNPTEVTINNPVSAIAPLQDFFITAITPWVDASVGQFKIPVSWEGYNSSAKLLTPERTPVSRRFGDKRDIGVRLTKSFKRWMYSAGVFNGQGQNNFDKNLQKDVSLRLEVYPVAGLTLGGVVYDSIGERELAGTKDRWEADLRYEHGPFLVQAEYLRGRDVRADGAGAITGQGFYVAAAYTIDGKRLCGALQPVVRVGLLDADVDRDVPGDGDDEFRHYDVGINYDVRGNELKLQGFYSRVDFFDRADTDQLILAAQVWY